MIKSKIVIGAGLYGLYTALKYGEKNEKVVILECDSEAFARATYVNQARIHMGYHYPRSISTAIKSKNYFDRFCKDYDKSILSEFKQIYATSSNFSWTNAQQFEKFCNDAGIMCEAINRQKYFKNDSVDGAFLTQEYTYDAMILKQLLLDEISLMSNVSIVYNVDIKQIDKVEKNYVLKTNFGDYVTNYLINTTYASCNQIHKMLGIQPFKIKYELCEIILCKVNDNLKDIGLTIMDGPFFSIMPFGKTGYHSLTSVTFTPHVASYDDLPTFDCQKRSNGTCSPKKLGNCNKCVAKPDSAWPYMSSLAKKYMNDELKFEYVKSLYSMKPIFKASEIDDSRPTVIKKLSDNPTFISVLSGKINTMYDLDEVINND